MRRIKLFLLVVGFTLISCFTFLGNTLTASAEETFDFYSAEMQAKCAELTDTDYIREDFTLDEYFEAFNEDKKHYTAKKYGTIEAAALQHGADLLELIPAELLEHKGNYFYSGKEYAFYVQNTGIMAELIITYQSPHTSVEMQNATVV